MGAHGTLEEALANVSSFAEADARNERAMTKSDRKHGSKDKDRNADAKKASKKAHKKERRCDSKKDKDAKKAKHGKRAKSDKRSKAGRAGSPEASDDSDSGSDSGGRPVAKAANRAPQGGLQAELARARHAARCTRELLLRYPDQRRDLRQLLWTVDQGNALDVSGVADVTMRERLIELFSNLPLERTKKGVFLRKPGGPSVLTQLGHLFDETPAQLRSACERAAATDSIAQAAAASSTPASAQAAGAVSRQEQTEAGGHDRVQAPAAKGSAGGGGNSEPTSNGGHSRAEAGADSAAAAAAARAGGPASELNVVREGSIELDYGSDDEPAVVLAGPEPSPGGGASVRPDIGPDCGRVVGANFEPAIGPAAGPPKSDVPPEAAGNERAQPSSLHGVPPHAHGPVRPPPELLAAAQEAAAAMAAEEAAARAEEEADTFLGPMPPDVVAEAEEAGADKPTAEVLRICRLLAVEEGYLTFGGKDAAPAPDAYEVLGVEPKVEAAAARRQFMKLSLWVHPDKNAHPRAMDAFHAADVAYKTIKDPERRRQLDAAREDLGLRKAAISAAEDAERARQWRVARGTATAEDLAGPIRSEPEGRGAWMTELPEARRPARQPAQVNVTAFSASGVKPAVADRAWAETPSQKLARLTAAAEAGPAALPGPAADAAQKRAAATAQALDTFNAGNRQKTLVEVHQEKLAAEKKEKKRQKKRKAEEAAAGKGAGDDWSREAHAWRPFDRERDLGHAPTPATPAEMLKKAGSLANRFGGGASSGTGRSFL